MSIFVSESKININFEDFMKIIKNNSINPNKYIQYKIYYNNEYSDLFKFVILLSNTNNVYYFLEKLKIVKFPEFQRMFNYIVSYVGYDKMNLLSWFTDNRMASYYYILPYTVLSGDYNIFCHFMTELNGNQVNCFNEIYCMCHHIPDNNRIFYYLRLLLSTQFFIWSKVNKCIQINMILDLMENNDKNMMVGEILYNPDILCFVKKKKIIILKEDVDYYFDVYDKCSKIIYNEEAYGYKFRDHMMIDRTNHKIESIIEMDKSFYNFPNNVYYEI